MATEFPFLPFTKIGPGDICHYSKQKCLPFPVSTSMSSNIFDLVHANTWGPIIAPSLMVIATF